MEGRERRKPIISRIDLGNTTPMLGLTQYFFGFVFLTCNNTINSLQIKIYKLKENKEEKIK